MLQLLRKIAFPFSLIYAIVVHVRNFLFDKGVFTSISYETPTLCIGNLSVGGTGKTPMIEYLVRLLHEHRVAVLSRGYKRKSKGFLLAGSQSSVEDLGDEPFQLHKKFSKVTVAVDADRRNGISKLEELVSPDIILLDDAFQHRRVKPRSSILLTAYTNLFVDDWYLPTGDLRDSKREAKRANIIVVTKCPKALSIGEKQMISEKLKQSSHQKILFSSLKYGANLSSCNGSLEFSELEGKNIALVTGIASPMPLVNHLKQIGIQFKHFDYADHHYFTKQEIEKLKGFDIVLTTEKDYVRLDGQLPKLFYLEVAHHFNENDHLVLEQVVNGLV
ncbi:tetraacyldisaccharide 4'-kinase [Flagellimonas sp. HMM57]|uniref:tetraacyldisaccharide 4'-kinase n=1 Tax=unclassified Flagellimonas TaxID=2644544 RepID=UPI0013D781D1|nr:MULTISPECIES: tetraacyldisaccharide 4'-kinase [unclassified Flagellimonas]UII76671.1 tetraacyldisaccharide 4'-kinase [Flagellimonas sp. HMM57]